MIFWILFFLLKCLSDSKGVIFQDKCSFGEHCLRILIESKESIRDIPIHDTFSIVVVHTMLINNRFKSKHFLSDILSFLVNIRCFNLLEPFDFTFNIRETHASLPNLYLVTWKLIYFWINVATICSWVAVGFIDPFVVFEILFYYEKAVSWICLICCHV